MQTNGSYPMLPADRLRVEATCLAGDRRGELAELAAALLAHARSVNGAEVSRSLWLAAHYVVRVLEPAAATV